MLAGNVLPANDKQDADERSNGNFAPLDQSSVINIRLIQTKRSKNKNPERRKKQKRFHVLQGVNLLHERSVVVLHAHHVGQAERKNEDRKVGEHENKAVELSIFRRHLWLLLYHFSATLEINEAKPS
jgi:hypothetical protein